MYRTCLFCNGQLGANESIEAFPVGRRIAFDAKKGRLWAVCPRCGRWNLSPLDERWIAIEQCERSYRSTTLRVSTDNIGLAAASTGVNTSRASSATCSRVRRNDGLRHPGSNMSTTLARE